LWSAKTCAVPLDGSSALRRLHRRCSAAKDATLSTKKAVEEIYTVHGNPHSVLRGNSEASAASIAVVPWELSSSGQALESACSRASVSRFQCDIDTREGRSRYAADAPRVSVRSAKHPVPILACKPRRNTDTVVRPLAIARPTRLVAVGSSVTAFCAPVPSGAETTPSARCRSSRRTFRLLTNAVLGAAMRFLGLAGGWLGWLHSPSPAAIVHTIREGAAEVSTGALWAIRRDWADRTHEFVCQRYSLEDAAGAWSQETIKWRRSPWRPQLSVVLISPHDFWLHARFRPGCRAPDCPCVLGTTR
jgi:hypothetical protein